MCAAHLCVAAYRLAPPSPITDRWMGQSPLAASPGLPVLSSGQPPDTLHAPASTLSSVPHALDAGARAHQRLTPAASASGWASGGLGGGSGSGSLSMGSLESDLALPRLPSVLPTGRGGDRDRARWAPGDVPSTQAGDVGGHRDGSSGWVSGASGAALGLAPGPAAPLPQAGPLAGGPGFAEAGRAMLRLPRPVPVGGGVKTRRVATFSAFDDDDE
jgi:hypothetical protein